MSLRRALALAALLLLASLSARAGTGSSECLPADLALRVPLEPPAEIAQRVKSLQAAGQDNAKRREALTELFRSAGCKSVEERPDARLSGPTLVCGLPGRTSELVLVGASPDYNGVSSSALLAALAAVLSRSGRERSFELVAYGADPNDRGIGELGHVKNLFERGSEPALVVRLGTVGFGRLRLDPRSTESQGCRLQALADRLGLPPLELDRSADPPFFVDRRGGVVGWDIPPALPTPVQEPVIPGVPYAGLTGRGRVSLDGSLHYAAYRLLAAYLLTVDQLGVERKANFEVPGQ
jgi:hypothetical protein